MDCGSIKRDIERRKKVWDKMLCDEKREEFNEEFYNKLKESYEKLVSRRM